MSADDSRSEKLAHVVAARLEATMASTPTGQHLIEHGTLPPVPPSPVDDLLTTIMEFQRTLGEQVVFLAREIDRVRDA